MYVYFLFNMIILIVFLVLKEVLPTTSTLSLIWFLKNCELIFEICESPVMYLFLDPWTTLGFDS